MALTPSPRLWPLVLAVALTACGTTQSLRPVETDAHAFAPWDTIAPVYRLGVGDRLKIDYLLTPELSQDVVIEPDGAISLPHATLREEAEKGA